MAENFLEEQLRRIREMSEQMSRVRNRVAEFSAEVERDRALAKRSPLHEVRDFRRYSSIDENRSTVVAADGGRAPLRSTRSRRR